MKKLTNKQMLSITGGSLWFCTYKSSASQEEMEVRDERDPIGDSIIVEANSAVEAADKVHAQYGTTQVNCTRY